MGTSREWEFAGVRGAVTARIRAAAGEPRHVAVSVRGDIVALIDRVPA
ncbi:hypothetical protein [Actinomadura rubrisoli]|nr:hypothetical protein [Actinomadura rubrisoli]